MVTIKRSGTGAETDSAGCRVNEREKNQGIENVDFTEAPKTNEYTEHVKALAAAGEDKAVTLTEATREEAFRERTKFGEAARLEGYSTRTKGEREETDKNGNVKSVSITLVLTQRITRTRKPKTDESADQTTEADSVE